MHHVSSLSVDPRLDGYYRRAEGPYMYSLVGPGISFILTTVYCLTPGFLSYT